MTFVFFCGGFTIPVNRACQAISKPVAHILLLKPSQNKGMTGMGISGFKSSITLFISSPMTPETQEVDTNIAFG